MREVIEEIIEEYKQFIETNSKYGTKVIKQYTDNLTYFPTISCVISNNTSTNECTNDRREQYEAFYISVNIFAKNKTQGANIKVASQVIINELIDLTDMFFNQMKGMRKTLNEPVPNQLDQSILWQSMNFQCLVGNVRGNIIRR